jgi:phosphopantothenoylcysteine synthetase/decarboxylase
MRHIAAFSSGRTGVRIAEILRERGADVHLLGSSEAVLRAERIPSTETFTSTRDLMARMRNWLREHPKGWVIHSAAVGDYEAVAEKGKIASGQESLTIHLQAAPKIIDHLKAWAPESKLVGFKAAGPETSTEGLVAACRTLGFRCRANWVFGNVLGELEHTATLVDRFGAESFSDREAAFQVLAAHVLA